MGFYIQENEIPLSDVKKRIEGTDLIPSREILKRNLEEHFKRLSQCGIRVLADLRRELKNAAKIKSLSERSKIDEEYLTLLRREIEGYFPKASPLSEFGVLNFEIIKELEKRGYKNSVTLYEALENEETKKTLKQEVFHEDVLEEVFAMIGLTRIQWVSPLFSKMLTLTGYKDPQSIAAADAEILFKDILELNQHQEYYGGKIGLRDIKRLILGASYV